MYVNFNKEKRGKKNMKYETPKMTALTPAINAIQTPVQDKTGEPYLDGSTGFYNDSISAYADWE